MDIEIKAMADDSIIARADHSNLIDVLSEMAPPEAPFAAYALNIKTQARTLSAQALQYLVDKSDLPTLPGRDLASCQDLFFMGLDALNHHQGPTVHDRRQSFNLAQHITSQNISLGELDYEPDALTMSFVQHIEFDKARLQTTDLLQADSAISAENGWLPLAQTNLSQLVLNVLLEHSITREQPISSQAAQDEDNDGHEKLRQR